VSCWDRFQHRNPAPQARQHHHISPNGKRDFATAPATPIILDSTPAEKRSIPVLGVIPARLASTRLTRKVLRPIAGRPMLAWVYEAARACPQLDHVLIATDSDEVAGLCAINSWPVQMTSPDLPSGTDRLHAVAQLIDAAIYVNIQGDEPLLKPEHLTALLAPFANPAVEVTTLKVLCTPENIANPNAVKVVTDADGRALYFSRATIPFDRDASHPEYWKHIGLYAYRKSALNLFPTLPHRTLEHTERLEQLRFLENGIDIHVVPTPFDTIGVDTEADLARVEALLLHK
jgi:3-deoxy-manno-octulosonate cytidylyltransferase (CMP-KDO synthetase)